MPRISVIMGVYNTSSITEGLDHSIQSILQQTYADFEFLICDDGSSKKTQELLENCSRKDNRIRLVRTGKAFTLPQKLNVCLMYAKGEYIARQDDDDYSVKSRFEKQIDFLESHSNIAFVGCNAEEFCNQKTGGKREFPQYPSKEDFLFKMPFLHPTLMFRKVALDAANGYDESKWTILCEDYDLLLRLYEKKFSGANLQENLFLYHVSDQDYKKRKYRHRVNEAVTRYRRFKALNMLPKALPFVIKPLIVGLIPHQALNWIKKRP